MLVSQNIWKRTKQSIIHSLISWYVPVIWNNLQRVMAALIFMFDGNSVVPNHTPLLHAIPQAVLIVIRA